MPWTCHKKKNKKKSEFALIVVHYELRHISVKVSLCTKVCSDVIWACYWHQIFKAVFSSSLSVTYVRSHRVEALWFNSKFRNCGKVWKISTLWYNTQFSMLKLFKVYFLSLNWRYNCNRHGKISLFKIMTYVLWHAFLKLLEQNICFKLRLNLDIHKDSIGPS